MTKRLLRRLDRALLKIGLIRTSQIPQTEYDFGTGEIHLQFGHGSRTCVHGYICPTPDGPLKVIPIPSAPLF
jgi:hypothetical protein